MTGRDRATLALTAGSAQVLIDAQRGGRLSSLQVRGSELLVQPDAHADPMSWGCFPMVPFAGRLDRGELNVRGENHQLPLDLPPHAIHGTGYRAGWTVVDGQTLMLELAKPWPFRGTVTQSFDLCEDRLTITMAVSAGDRAMPVMVGWHPWFSRSLSGGEPVTLDIEPASMWERGDDHLPTGRLVPPKPRPWDDCVTDLAADPTLCWPGALEVRLRSSCPHWVIYDELDRGICVEPQTGPPNQITTDPQVLEPGENLTAWFELSWRVLD